jgi:hypothetical protein
MEVLAERVQAAAQGAFLPEDLKRALVLTISEDLSQAMAG